MTADTKLIHRQWCDGSGTLLAELAYDSAIGDAELKAIVAVFDALPRVEVEISCTGESVDVRCAQAIDSALLERLPRLTFRMWKGARR